MSEKLKIELSRFVNGLVASVEIAKVISIQNDYTCTVRLIVDDSVEIAGVNLSAKEDSADFYIKPKLNSIVLVAPIYNKQDYCVIMYSEIDSIVLLGGENGGLVISGGLKNILNEIKEYINGLLDKIKEHHHASHGTPSGLFNSLQPFAFSDLEQLENKKVKH